MTELITERLTMRPLGTADLFTAHKYCSDFDVAKYMMFLPNKSIDETIEFLQRAEAEWDKQSPAFYEFAICLNGIHIGAISLYLQNNVTAELGWILNKEYQGRGYCTECAFELVKFAKSLGLCRLVAHCDTRNIASYKVMEKIGMMRSFECERQYNDERGSAREYCYIMDVR